MDQESPYSPKSKELQPFLKDMIKTRDHLLTEKYIDFKTFRKHWDQILSPTAIDRFMYNFNRLSYNLNVTWEFFWEYFWQVNTVFAWMVTSFVLRHAVVLLLMFACAAGSFVSISHDIHHSRLPISPKKRSKKDLYQSPSNVAQGT